MTKINAEYSLTNLIECLELLQDAKNGNNGFLYNAGIKWLINRVKKNNELTTPDREEFHRKFYLNMKNK